MNQNTFICNHRTKSNSSWGGLVYAKDKTEAIMDGGNQTWYSFKNSIIEHLGCSSLRSSGQEHYKANQFALKEKKTQKKIKDINILVSAAIHVCKMNFILHTCIVRQLNCASLNMAVFAPFHCFKSLICKFFI